MENSPITGSNGLNGSNGFNGSKGLKGLKIACAVLLVIAVLAVYLQCFGFDFLRFDDPDYTFACAFVKDGLSWRNVCEAFANLRHGAVWMPVTWISYMADISLFGAGACGHHAVNVLIHLANSLVLLHLVSSVAMQSGGSGAPGDSRISGKPFLLKSSLFLVCFWALHPQRVEAVAWIASRKELLWAFFTLLGLLAWRGGRAFAALACCALACMSKPTAMVFPLLALILKPLKPPAPLKPLMPLKPLKPLRPRPLIFLSIMLAISVATGVIAIYSQTHPEGMSSKDLFYAPLGERLVGAATAIGLYLAQTVVPAGIHLDYRAVPGGWPLHCGLGLSVFALAALWLVIKGFKGFKGSKGLKGFKGSKGLKGFNGFAAVLFFTIALLPTLGLFGSFGEHARADRFLYVPAMAIPLFFKDFTFKGFENIRAIRVSTVAILAVLALYSFQTFRIASSYRDDISVFTRTLACDPDNGRALAHVGEARCAAGALDEGIELLRRSREVRPHDATDGKLAYALMRRGKASDWAEIRVICAPFASDPARDVKGQALEALGTAELKSRNWQKAAEFLGRSILAPARFYSAADAKLKLAFAWHNAGRRTEARKLFEAVSRYTRADLSARADEVLAVLDRSPNAMLFW